jgi:hypothetical protein
MKFDEVESKLNVSVSLTVAPSAVIVILDKGAALLNVAVIEEMLNVAFSCEP